ncbi:hypothetical protein Dimus_011293 [Dionaea muscipula]
MISRGRCRRFSDRVCKRMTVISGGLVEVIDLTALPSDDEVVDAPAIRDDVIWSWGHEAMSKKIFSVNLEEMKNRVEAKITGKGLQSALFIRQQCSKNATKLADLDTEIESLRSVKTELRKQLSHSDEEIDRLKRELSNRESDNKQLVEEMKDVAMCAVIETRGTLMKEYKDGQTLEWDVEGDINLMEELLSSSSLEAIDPHAKDSHPDDLDVANPPPVAKE